MRTFLSIALSLMMAFGCAHWARRRGRNPGTWFVAGGLFGIFAFIALFLFPVRRRQAMTAVQTPSPPTLTLLSPLHMEKLWYYLDEQKTQLGPMSFDALGRAWREGAVREQTFVWNEAMDNWQRFGDVVRAQQ